MPVTLDIFKKYPNPIFIETGSYLGDGVQLAIEAGFQRIITIELHEKYFHHTRNRFVNCPNIQVILGDSYKVLPSLLAELNEPITFWLDGHYSGPGTGCGDFQAPLYQELEAIKGHHIKTHTILIDDLYSWKDPQYGIDVEELKKRLFQINPKYRLLYEDYSGYPQTILVAQP